MHFFTTNEINATYDIKGSWIKRHVGGRRDEVISGKDMDLKKKLFIDNDKKELLTNQLNKDTQFLADRGIIDYSLLLGIHQVNKRAYASFKRKLTKPKLQRSGSHDKLSSLEEQPLPVRELAPYLYDARPDLKAMYVSSFQLDQGGLLSGDGNEIYYLSIIDILTKYNGDKMIERFWKVYILGNDKFGVSVVPTPEYRTRFMEFLSKKVVL